MSPWHKAFTTAQRYDQSLQYARDDCLPADTPRPLPTRVWPAGNVEFLERYRDWLLGGGTSEMVTHMYHILMAGHVFGLTLKPYRELDLDSDLDCAMEYVKAKRLSETWTRNCRNSLIKFRRFLRLERGLGEIKQVTPYEIGSHTDGLPVWLVSELERFQRLQQRNWRTARMEDNIRRFWSTHLKVWRFLCEERQVDQLADLKRQHILDYIDQRLNARYAVSGVNGELHTLHSFLAFLLDEGYAVPQALLRIPGLKPPDSLPRYLTDEQVGLLRDYFERRVIQTQLSSHRRLALMDRALFYLLWQCGLRSGEVEELRLEDLDLDGRKMTIRDGKGRKDRSVYVTETALQALQAYLRVRGPGSEDHVFLFRNAPLMKSFIHGRIKAAGERVGVKAYPHRLRHTCATQLLNAGCRITSIQKFLGHKKLNTTMIYARALDPTLAEDYFAAMRRVEQRLQIGPYPKQESKTENEVVNVPLSTQLLAWAERLALPELGQNERVQIAENLKRALSLNFPGQPSPPTAYAG